jgi:subfamily B ATP-binding cassette protein MsbA
MSPNQLLIKFALKSPSLIIVNFILGFSSALFNGVSTALIVPLLLAFMGQEQNLLRGGPPILHKLLSLFDGFPESRRLPVMFAAVLFMIVLKNIASYSNTIVSGHLSRILVNGMRLEGVKLLLDVDLDFYAKHKIGDISNRVNGEVGRAAISIRVAISMFSNIITIFVFLFFLISLSWQLTLIATALLSLVALSNQFLIHRSHIIGKILSEKSRLTTNKLLEILIGIRLIKASGNEEIEYAITEQYLREREHAEFESQSNSALIPPLNEVMGILIILLVVISGRYLFANQLQFLSAILLTYLLFLFRLLPLIGILNSNRSQFANNAASVELVADFLRRDNKPFMVKGHEPYKKLAEGIYFKNVSFSYPSHEKLVLNGIDLWIPKGQTIALVGSSGAGKSTIADLLPRFYDPTNGCITLDGKDLRDFDLKRLRRAMGIVSQDTFLFNNSVRYNIAYGLTDVSEEEIVAAAKRANAYEFISQLPQGFDTEIGDRGILLSGGQRQRLAIARALLRNPDILILDEATSALDTVSERLVQEAIDELCQDRTTLVIAHRLSTVQKAHQIAVLDKGRIVELGNHEQLLQQKGYYARLYNLQFAKEAVAETLPERFQDSSDRLASHYVLTRLSYEARSHLNTLLGSLRLLADDLIDGPDEQHELLEESYSSAMRLLSTIEFFEENTNRILLKDP